MKILAIASLTILFLLAPYAQGQTDGFPPCSRAELTWALDQQADYDALIARLTGGEASLEIMLDFSEAQIIWRETLWSQLPPCAEAIDIAVLMSQISNDMGAMGALTYTGISLSLNRYKDRLYFEGSMREQLKARLADIAALIESEERPEEPLPGDRQLAACAGDELQALEAALRTNEDLIVMATEIRSRSALLDYISEKLAWRDHAWDGLPPCAEAIEIGQLMSQAANDFATAMSYRYADAPKDSNPFDGILQNELNQLGDWLAAMLEAAGIEIETSVVGAAALDLERCSKSAIAEVFVRLYGFNDLIELAFDVQDFDGYRAYIAAQIEWRNQLFAQMPLCEEALASSTVVANLAGDLSAVFALSFAGIDAAENPYWEVVNDSMPVVDETLEAFPFYVDDAAETPGSPDRLPACTAAERVEMSATIEDNRYAFAQLASEIETREDLLEFSDLQMLWRNLALTELPLCQEAIQAGLLLIQLTGDTVPMAALQLFVGLPLAQNPYWDEISAAREAIAAIIENADGE